MNTATSIDFKQILVDNITGVGATYAADFGHLPADKTGAVPMGKARTAVAVTAECAGFNFYMARVVRGETGTRSAEEREAFYASLDTGEKAVQALKESVAALAEAVQNVDEAELTREVTMPWGMTVPLHRAVAIATGHMMYHDGQINYIQSLFGDDENHWG